MSLGNFNGGALLIDGASRDHLLAWLYQNYPSHQPLPLLFETPYAALMETAPILIDAPRNCALHNDWNQGVETLRNAVWLQTRLPTDQLFKILQRRLRVRSPDGREFWLRMADARPLLQAWKANAVWPPGFWHGIDSLWLQDTNGPVLAWHNDQPELDSVAVAPALEAPTVLDWPLLEALTLETDRPEEAAV